MNQAWKYLGATALALSLAACGPEDERLLALRELAIINGYPDVQNNHDSIIFMYIRRPGQGGNYCSATLIGRRTVLTAAHCVEGADAENVTLYFGRDMSNPVITRGAADLLVHPSYPMIWSDIALLRMDGAPPPGFDTLPPLRSDQGITQADVGKPVEFVGYGQTEENELGVRLTITLPLGWVCTSPAGCGELVGDEWYSFTTNSICIDESTGGTCFGDSGGPALIMREGQEYVAGVHSYVGDDACSTYACDTKVDAFESFIDDFAHPDGEACISQNECLSGFCVGGVCCRERCDDPCSSCNEAGSEGTCVPLADGTSCSDGDVCNGEESCLAGACQPGESLDCDDATICTVDTCDPEDGCVFIARTDGYACGTCMNCIGGDCVAIPDCPPGKGGGCHQAPGAPPPSDPAGLILLALALAMLGARGRR